MDVLLLGGEKLNRGLLALIIIIIIIVIAGVVLYSQFANTNTNPNNYTGNASANNTTNMNNTNNTVATVINIQNGAFNPNNVTVKSGTNIQWINRDNISHQVVSDNGQFQGPVQNQGSVWNFYFAKSGVFGYLDSYNPSESGTLTIS